MDFKLREKVIDLLKKHPEQRFTAREIAEQIFAAHPDESQAKKERSKKLTTDEDLLKQLRAEVGSGYPDWRKKHPELKTAEGRPRRYYYSEKSDTEDVQAAESASDTSTANTADAGLGEHDLYPLLSRYLRSEFRLYSKRIDEKRSSNNKGKKGSNQWLHPDLVAMEVLSADWDREVQDCVKLYSDKRTKLWSFEVKRDIDKANVRKHYFQAVSNSSWSNFGYLVASEIGDGQDTLKELRMLFAAHGIGLIRLDVESPEESQVLIPAREREEIDWDMVNRLAVENKDFLAYVKAVRKFYQTGEPSKSDWDVPEDEE